MFTFVSITTKMTKIMRGRPAAFNGEDIIQKAMLVFTEKGYYATSLDDLLQTTGMGSGSFYNTFKGGKKELFRKVLAQRRAAFQQFKSALQKSDNSLELIKSFFRGIAATDKHTHLQGCIIANTVMEMSCLDDELEAEAVAILKEVEQMYTAAIRNAQVKQHIRNQTDAAILGRYLITLWNGINVTRRMYPNPEILAEQIEMQLAIIS
jgi:TetR/AcrR family transcriptional repressor of nem operon